MDTQGKDRSNSSSLDAEDHGAEKRNQTQFQSSSKSPETSPPPSSAAHQPRKAEPPADLPLASSPSEMAPSRTTPGVRGPLPKPPKSDSPMRRPGAQFDSHTPPSHGLASSSRERESPQTHRPLSGDFTQGGEQSAFRDLPPRPSMSSGEEGGRTSRKPVVGVPPPPARPPEVPKPPRPLGSISSIVPPSSKAKPERNIRPRRLALLVLILVGFVGGVVLAVWALLRSPHKEEQPPTESPPLVGSPLSEVSPEGGTSEPLSKRDTDGDGLSDEEEINLGTNLAAADTDNDGYTDKEEIDAGFDPLGPGKLDTDRDGLADPDEACWKTDVRNPDTDGDGYLDGQEVMNGFDPTVPSPGDKLEKSHPCLQS